MTEANACIVTPLRGTRKRGSIGVPIPDVEARIVDAETGMETLAPGAVGELVVRCPQQMQGYRQQSDETAQVLRDGWIYTGDIARMDDFRWDLFLAALEMQARHALFRALDLVPNPRICLNGPGEYTEIGHFSNERVGSSLPDVSGQRR